MSKRLETAMAFSALGIVLVMLAFALNFVYAAVTADDYGARQGEWQSWPIVAVDQNCEYRDGRPCTYALHRSPDGRTHNDSIEGRWTLEELVKP